MSPAKNEWYGGWFSLLGIGVFLIFGFSRTAELERRIDQLERTIAPITTGVHSD